MKNYFRKLKTNGDIEDVAVYTYSLNPIDTLVAYLEYYLKRNISTWTYGESGFYKTIKETRFGYSYIDKDDNVYYVRKQGED